MVECDPILNARCEVHIGTGSMAHLPKGLITEAMIADTGVALVGSVDWISRRYH